MDSSVSGQRGRCARLRLVFCVAVGDEAWGLALMELGGGAGGWGRLGLVARGRGLGMAEQSGRLWGGGPWEQLGAFFVGGPREGVEGGGRGRELRACLHNLITI